MTSFLTDMVLIVALIITSWRTGFMYKELRRLRSAQSAFGKSLEESDAAINRAAHAVIVLKSEGVRTLAALESRVHEAGEAIERLDHLLRRAELADALAEAEMRGGRASRSATATDAIR